MNSFLTLISQLPSRPLLSGVLAEVGSVPSITALIKLMEDAEVAPLTQALLFGSLNINLKSAKPLRILLVSWRRVMWI